MVTFILLFLIIFSLVLLLNDTRKQRKKIERYFSILNTPGLAQVKPGNHAQVTLKKPIHDAAASLVKDALTLVLPTHNRHHYLKRALEYYGSWNVKVIVVDSTPVSFGPELASGIQYVHCPHLSFGEKLNEAMQQVVTPYVLLSADDDFISPIAVKAAMSHLETHPDCSCAQGWHAGFALRKKKIKWWAMHLFALDLQVDALEPEARILKQCSSYMNCFYALHRTEVLKSFFCVICPTLPQETLQKRPELLEVSQALNTVACGSHIILPMLWIAREMIADSAGAIAQADNKKDDTARMAQQDGEFFRALADSFRDVLRLDGRDALLQQALKNYTVFRGKWARQMLAHFGPVENVIFSAEDAALLHQVEKLVRKHLVSGK